MKKVYTENVNVCKIIFNFPEELAAGAEKVHLVSDFNKWDTQATPMEKNKNGLFSTCVILPIGKEYQFRYLLDQHRWENDAEEDKAVPSVYKNIKNSVIVT